MITNQLPNIILIVLDAARSNYFGCYGHSDGLTPNLDKLAEESIVYKNFIASGPGTAISQGSMFLGQHPTRSGISHILSQFDQNVSNLPSMLKDAGYRTFGHSKQLVQPIIFPETFRFDEIIYKDNKNDLSRINLKREAINLIKKSPKVWKAINWMYEGLNSPEKVLRQKRRRFDGKASLEYLYKKCKDMDGPLFLYTTLLHPHTPFCPPEWILRNLLQKKNQSFDPRGYQIQNQFQAFMNGDLGECKEEIEAMITLYKGELMYADYIVGKFLERLKTIGKYDNSLIFLTSDHGELLGEHGEINHGVTLYDEVLRIPAMIKMPGSAECREVDDCATHFDILPTIMDFIGFSSTLTQSDIYDGISLFNLNAQRALVVESPPVLFPERFNDYPKVKQKQSRIWRGFLDKYFKYIWRSDGYRALFKSGDYESGENNLIGQKPKIAEKMHNEMLKYYSDINPNFRIDEYPIKISPTAAGYMTSPRYMTELERHGFI